MQVIEEVEHEDGSATYVIDMTEEERKAVMEQGLIWMVVAGITEVTPTAVLEAYMREKNNG